MKDERGEAGSWARDPRGNHVVGDPVVTRSTELINDILHVMRAGLPGWVHAGGSGENKGSAVARRVAPRSFCYDFVGSKHPFNRTAAVFICESVASHMKGRTMRCWTEERRSLFTARSLSCTTQVVSPVGPLEPKVKSPT